MKTSILPAAAVALTPLFDDRHEPASSPALEAELKSLWAGTRALDRFDRVQLEEVLRVCESARSLSEAGRELFAASRQKKKAPNDADRLRKYLARFDLSWNDIHPD